MKTIINETIQIYNNQIPHYFSYMSKTTQMYTQNEIQMRTYKTNNVGSMIRLLFKSANFLLI